MKHFSLVSILSFALLLLGACGNAFQEKKFQSGFEGMYVGELPCADCPGILTHSTFYPDSTVAITSLYYDSDDTSETEWGTWEVNDNILQANMPYNMTYYYVEESDSTIMMTDSLGKASESLAEFYRLKKEAPLTRADFAGNYVLGDLDEPESYRQLLSITPVEGSEEVLVKVTSEGAGKGCEFSAEGLLVNNQIEVDLTQLHEEMTATLTIRFTGKDTLLLFSSRFDQRFALMYFCGGGGSLAGDYVRVNN